MSEPVLKIKIKEWVDCAKPNTMAYQQRQTVEVTLNAIAMKSPLNTKMFLKGGILMGLAYDSPRQTFDVDLSTNFTPDNLVDDKIREQLDSTFPRAAANLGYASLILKTNSVERRPKAIFEDAEFPALRFRIASAKRNTTQEKALHEGKGPCLINLDISFNEPLQQIQILELTGGQELRAYSLVDLIAEKYRAMLQQIPRNRRRPQDVYDLDLLIRDDQINSTTRRQILDAFIETSYSHHLRPDRASLDDPEIKRRSGAEWKALKLELNEVPHFEDCFARVSEFYQSLPWDSN